jgi:hypothetical protein
MRSNPGSGRTPIAAISTPLTDANSNASKDAFHKLPIAPDSPQSASDFPYSKAGDNEDKNEEEGTKSEAEPTVVKTSDRDPIAWSGTDDALNHSHARRSEQNDRTPQRKPFWTRFFAAGLPQLPPSISQVAPQMMRDEDEAEVEVGDDGTECLKCPKNRDLVCINGTHYGFCDEGCVEARRLKDGMKCVEGRIYGVRLFEGRLTTKAGR